MLVYSSCIADIVDTVLMYCEITIAHSYRCTYLQRTFAVRFMNLTHQLNLFVCEAM